MEKKNGKFWIYHCVGILYLPIAEDCFLIFKKNISKIHPLNSHACIFSVQKARRPELPSLLIKYLLSPTSLVNCHKYHRADFQVLP